MLKSHRVLSLLLALNLAGAALAMSAQAAPVNTYGAYGGAASADQNYGSAASDAAATRQIDITASTKWVNVANGETVRFNVDGQSFVWNFATLRSSTSFDLSAIAPKDAHVANVRVYVASNPLYRG